MVDATGSAEGAQLIDPFIKGCFSGKVIATRAHPKNKDTTFCTPSTRRKCIAKRMATLRKDGAVTEQDLEKEDVPNASPRLLPCIAGKSRAALDTLFNKTLSETRSWFVFCVNPNDLQAIHFP